MKNYNDFHIDLYFNKFSVIKIQGNKIAFKKTWKNLK